MAMRTATPAETKLIESFQANLKAAKIAVRAARKDMKALYKILEAGGAYDEAADVNSVKAEATVAYGALDKVDAVAGKAAIACYTDPGPIILAGHR